MAQKVIEVEGESVKEAIDKGLKRLGKSQDDADIEIIQEPDSGIFETEHQPARIRMSTEGVDLLETFREIVENILTDMGLEDFELSVSIDGDFYRANIDAEEDLRYLIGRYGETLNAIQHVSERMLNQLTDDETTLEVIVDADDYRERRREDLQQLAREVSQQALEEEREVELEPMIPVERKIVHQTVKDLDDVKSHSIGEDTNRRVVILPRGQS
ncbi:MAG: RNA-binding cell elongation regulator Jag/EloR [bacterium]